MPIVLKNSTGNWMYLFCMCLGICKKDTMTIKIEILWLSENPRYRDCFQLKYSFLRSECKAGFLAGIRCMLLYFHNEESTEPNQNVVQNWQKTFRADAHKIMQQITHKAQNTTVFGPLLLWKQILALLLKKYSKKSCNGPSSAPVQSLHPERGPWKVLPSFCREMCPGDSGSSIKSEITWFSHFCWSEPESSPQLCSSVSISSCLGEAQQALKWMRVLPGTSRIEIQIFSPRLVKTLPMDFFCSCLSLKGS